MSKNFNQPVCTSCWVEDNFKEDAGEVVGRLPIQMASESWIEDLTTCCKCGRPTTSRIYIRIDPDEVPFPQDPDEVPCRP